MWRVSPQPGGHGDLPQGRWLWRPLPPTTTIQSAICPHPAQPKPDLSPGRWVMGTREQRGKSTRQELCRWHFFPRNDQESRLAWASHPMQSLSPDRGIAPTSTGGCCFLSSPGLLGVRLSPAASHFALWGSSPCPFAGKLALMGIRDATDPLTHRPPEHLPALQPCYCIWDPRAPCGPSTKTGLRPGSTSLRQWPFSQRAFNPAQPFAHPGRVPEQQPCQAPSRGWGPHTLGWKPSH